MTRATSVQSPSAHRVTGRPGGGAAESACGRIQARTIGQDHVGSGVEPGGLQAPRRRRADPACLRSAGCPVGGEEMRQEKQGCAVILLQPVGEDVGHGGLPDRGMCVAAGVEHRDRRVYPAQTRLRGRDLAPETVGIGAGRCLAQECLGGGHTRGIRSAPFGAGRAQGRGSWSAPGRRHRRAGRCPVPAAWCPLPSRSRRRDRAQEATPAERGRSDAVRPGYSGRARRARRRRANGRDPARNRSCNGRGKAGKSALRPVGLPVRHGRVDRAAEVAQQELLVTAGGRVEDGSMRRVHAPFDKRCQRHELLGRRGEPCQPETRLGAEPVRQVVPDEVQRSGLDEAITVIEEAEAKWHPARTRNHPRPAIRSSRAPCRCTTGAGSVLQARPLFRWSRSNAVCARKGSPGAVRIAVSGGVPSSRSGCGRTGAEGEFWRGHGWRNRGHGRWSIGLAVRAGSCGRREWVGEGRRCVGGGAEQTGGRGAGQLFGHDAGGLLEIGFDGRGLRRRVRWRVWRQVARVPLPGRDGNPACQEAGKVRKCGGGGGALPRAGVGAGFGAVVIHTVPRSPPDRWLTQAGSPQRRRRRSPENARGWRKEETWHGQASRIDNAPSSSLRSEIRVRWIRSKLPDRSNPSMAGVTDRRAAPSARSSCHCRPSPDPDHDAGEPVMFPGLDRQRLCGRGLPRRPESRAPWHQS